MTIHIVYPEDRVVSEATILTWHADAIANGEIPASSKTEDALEAAQELEHIGQITLSGQQRVELMPKDSPGALYRKEILELAINNTIKNAFKELGNDSLTVGKLVEFLSTLPQDFNVELADESGYTLLNRRHIYIDGKCIGFTTDPY